MCKPAVFRLGMTACGRSIARAAAKLLVALVALPVSMPAQAQTSDDSATYTVTFQGNWTTASTPDGVVGGAHFTTLIGAVHNAMVTFWAPGGTATTGVENVAELGSTSTFQSEINANSNAVSVIRNGVGGGGRGSATFEVTVTRDHPLVTLLSMIGPSPDWFVGVSGRSLLDAQAQWQSRLEIDLFPYDAGTEEGAEFSLGNAATSPREAIMSIKGTGKFSDVRMARLTFVLSSVPVDEATVSVEAGSATEGSPVPFTVRLSETVDSDVVLGWTTGGDATPNAQPAMAGTDYTAVTDDSVTILANQETATFQVTTIQDTAPEGDETFAVTVTGSTLPAGVTIATATAAGTIVDDDGVVVSVESGSVLEGSRLPFTARLSAPVGSDVVLGWTTGDDTTPNARRATAGTDYTAVTNGSVTIPANETSAAFEVQTLTDDARVEGDETFAVTVAGSTLPAGVVVLAGTLAVGRIRDADRATVTVEAVAPATEGVSVSFRVTLSDPVLPEDIVVRWSTGDDASPNARQATAEEDYAAEADGSVMIPAGATGATFEVVTLADDLQEDAETFAVTLTGSSLPGKVEVPADARAIGTIREPVTMPPPVRPPPPRARVTLTGAEATEGMPVEFTVSLSRTASSPVPLTWSTTDATASAGEDYTAITAQAVMIPAGQTSAVFMVQTVDDAVPEDDEVFSVNVAAAGRLPRRVTVPANLRASGTIEDNDDLVVEVAAAGAVPEGATAEFIVTVPAPVSSPVPLTWSTAGGTATAGDDYTAVTAQAVTIAAGQTSAMFTVETTDDAMVEVDETVIVAVAAAGALPIGVTVPDGLRATALIEDDDSRASGFTDDPVVAGATVVKAVHLTELRDRIDDLRMAHGLQRFAYMDPTITAGHTRVRAVHLVELRTALDQTYDAAERRRPRYTGAVGADAAVRAVHINDLRRSIQAME